MDYEETEVVSDPLTGSVREERHVSGDGERGQGPVAASSEVVSSFNPARRAIELTYLAFGIIEGLLLIRMVLKLLGANPQAGFANFIYGVTAVFLAPFRNLLPTVGTSQSQLEMSVVVAILVYALIGWVVARLIAIMYSRGVTVARRSSSGGVRTRTE